MSHVLSVVIKMKLEVNLETPLQMKCQRNIKESQKGSDDFPFALKIKDSILIAEECCGHSTLEHIGIKTMHHFNLCTFRPLFGFIQITFHANSFVWLFCLFEYIYIQNRQSTRWVKDDYLSVVFSDTSLS